MNKEYIRELLLAKKRVNSTAQLRDLGGRLLDIITIQSSKVVHHHSQAIKGTNMHIKKIASSVV